MFWFRVELDTSGAVRACTQVAKTAENNGLVCYVEARDSTGAVTRALELFRARLTCTACGALDTLETGSLALFCWANGYDQHTCKTCRASARESRRAAEKAGAREYAARRRAMKAGDSAKVAEIDSARRAKKEQEQRDREAAYEANRRRSAAVDDRLAGLKRATYADLLYKYDSDPRAFRDWLVKMSRGLKLA